MSEGPCSYRCSRIRAPVRSFFISEERQGKNLPDIVKENKMGTMPVRRLLFTMSLPMIVSMLVQALYNIVDGVFVAAYSPDAYTALNCAFPAQNLMIGVATGTGVGLNSLLSRSLGEKNFKKANQVAENGIFLALISFVVFFLFGMFGSAPFIRFQNNDPAVVEFGRQYLTICCCVSIGVFLQITFERLMQATGKTIFTLYTQGAGAIINIILDPIFIFSKGDVFRGFEMPFGFGMGIAGAAIATVIGQCVAALIAIFCHFRFNHEIKVKVREFRPRAVIIRNIYEVGIPSILMVCIGSVMTAGINRILSGFAGIGKTAVSVFGTYFKLQSFVFMPIFGMNNGLIPILAYNYGAGKRSRMMTALRTALIAALLYMLLGLLVMQVLPGPLLKIFSASDQMLEIGIPALRTMSLSFLFAGICIVLMSCMQALGRGFYAMGISVSRQLVVLLPVAYLLSLAGEIGLIWFSFPIAEAASVIAASIFFGRLYRRIIRKIPDQV